jgi:nucleotide-binding universal stress UspA family protein
MDIKAILVPLGGGPTDEQVLSAAAGIAKTHGAHITALYAATDPGTVQASMLTDGSGLAMNEGLLESLEVELEKRRDHAEAHFAIWRKSSGVPATKRSDAAGASAALVVEIGPEADVVRTHAVVADLVILPSPTAGSSELTLEAALFEGGRPVLIVPETPMPAADAPIVVAWNGSAQAAHALSAALPFLAKARAVTLLHAGHADRHAMLNPVAAYLALHGIDAAIRGIPDEGDAGKAILDEAARLDAGLLVMGAYTHSRVREFIFGGVTNHMLRNAKLPILTAH